MSPELDLLYENGAENSTRKRRNGYKKCKNESGRIYKSSAPGWKREPGDTSVSEKITGKRHDSSGLIFSGGGDIRQDQMPPGNYIYNKVSRKSGERPALIRCPGVGDKYTGITDSGGDRQVILFLLQYGNVY